MIANTKKINQGLTLTHCRTEKFKAGLIALSVPLPITKNAYLTSLLLSVLRRGTQKYPTLGALNRRLDLLFGTELSIRNFYRGDCHIIGFCADLLDADYLPAESEALLPEVLDLMCEILFHPLLDENGLLTEKYVESEKNLQCTAIRAAKNNPRGYALDKLRELTYRDEPTGVPIYGSEAEVMAVTPKILTEHWKELLCTLTVDCFYIGSMPAAETESMINRVVFPYLSGTDRASCDLGRICFSEKEMRAAEELPVAQSQLGLSFRTAAFVGDSDFYAMAVYNELLGASPVSKLFVNVREKHSLCYSCSSHYQFYKGVIFVLCGLDAANRAFAEKEIFCQVADIRKGKFTDEELAAAKRSLEGTYRQVEDSPAATESYYYGRSLYGVEDTPSHSIQKIKAVTREDVLRAAEKITLDTVFFLKGTGRTNGEVYNDEEI